MHGNVAEWCQDWYSENYYASSPNTDPGGPPEGKLRVFRGGSWKSHPAHIRSCFRCGAPPEASDKTVGFRVVVTTEDNADKPDQKPRTKGGIWTIH
jgi:formylglycine-generating enzyme required for sulfatase activity